ncbi:MAG: hypothetical protein ACIAXF_11100 [Phycisphaerales bacterium JB063]
MTAITRRLYPTLFAALACTLIAVLVTKATATTTPDPKAPANSVFAKYQDDEDWAEWKGQFAEIEMMNMHLELMSHFTELIGDMHTIADSPSTSGVLAVMSVEDNMETDDAIDFLEDMLKDTDDETIQRAIRIKLIDFYKNAGQHDDAVEQIEALITG